MPSPAHTFPLNREGDEKACYQCSSRQPPALASLVGGKEQETSRNTLKPGIVELPGIHSDPAMDDQELYSGLIRLHVLYHATREPVFGLGMIRELRRHGYRIGPGTLYPLLHRMEEKGYLRSRSQSPNGRSRRCYTATPRGRRALEQAKARVEELFDEVVKNEAPP
jgi:PadR family transcriptional regulator, regulatory protein PadR